MTNKKDKDSPAMAGPQVRGMEHMASKQPIACDAPEWPTRSNAMGPRREMKQPSKNPIPKEITIKKAIWLAAVSSIVSPPMQKNET